MSWQHIFNNSRVSIAAAALLFILLGYSFIVQHKANHFTHPQMLNWQTLRELNPGATKIPETIQVYNGKAVRLVGFMVPLEDTAGQVSEFLFMPQSNGCIHAPPPPPNQVIDVKMSIPIAYTWKAIWLKGTFSIKNSAIAGYASSFYISGDEVRPYDGAGFPLID